MGDFDVKDFCDEPSFEKLLNKRIKKDQWKYIATYFSIDFTSDMTKELLKNTVIENLVNVDILEKSALEELTPIGLNVTGMDEIVPESGILGHDVGDKQKFDTNWSSERLAFEREKVKMEMELAKLRLDREYELAYQKIKVEQENREKDRAFKEKELAQGNLIESVKINAGKKFDLRKNVTLVPSFDELDPDA